MHWPGVITHTSFMLLRGVVRCGFLNSVSPKGAVHDIALVFSPGYLWVNVNSVM